MTYLRKFNKLLKRICQLETNKYYSNAQILDQFIAELKDKLIKKVCPHAPEDLATAIQQAKNYEIVIEETNCTKLVNLAIGETSSAAEEKIDQLIKKFENYFTNQQQQQQPQQSQQPQRYQLPQQSHLTANPTAIPTTTYTTLSVNNNRISLNNQLVLRNSVQPRPNYYHTQPNYLTMPEERDFYHIALSEGRAAAQQQNSSHNHTTIPPAKIAENANFFNIFSFEFEANKSPFLLSNAAANKQKAITAMYTEAEVEGKTIHLILDSGSTGSIITYQLMQHSDNYCHCQWHEKNSTLVGNDWLQKANAKLDWETQELQIFYQGQHVQVPATCGTFNKCSKKAPAFKFEPEKEKPIIETFMALGSMKQCFYIPLKCKDCHKNLSSMGACISPEEKYENHTCYYCKACHREQWGHLIKRSGKWDNTFCLTCEDMLPEECNWIDVAMRGGVCDQTCQYALSILEKVKRGTPFDAAYNSAFNKLYYYSHDAKIIFDLAITLINGTTQENVRQIKESEYIAYIFEIAVYNYKNEVKVYHQIASHIYLTKEAQAQWLEQMNIKLCEKCIMPCDEQWCSECYALSIPLPSKSDEYEIEFGEPEATEEIEAISVYLIENQFALQLKYFNNNGQGIKPEKTHEIDVGYNLRYPGKDTLTFKPKSLTKINLKIALEIPPGAMVQITLQLSLASKRINVRERIIDVGYTKDITIMLQNKTNKPFQIEHAKKIAQTIYLSLINISGLQLVSQREQLRKSKRGTKGFGSTGQFTVPKEQKKSELLFTIPIVLLNNIEIGVIHNNIFQQELSQTVPNFSEIIEHSLPKINPNSSSENYHVVIEKLSRINMGQLEPQQQNQFKELIAEFADIFAKNNNDLERTDLVQHQIYTGDAKPRRQQAY
ncbi:hypothetical protein G9A89_002723 [Geosiphon pyriformis]|nr:hypothetical protein G9A89_002723 [Geosiphon pyriformis]